MATIAEIAEKAGTSIAAVSLALNGKPGVGPELRGKILALAEEMGYKRSKRPSRSISILHLAKAEQGAAEYEKSFMADYANGIQLEAGREGLSVNIRFVESAPGERIGAAAAREAESSRAEGIVILGSDIAREDLLLLARLPRPKVFVDSYYPDINLDFIDIDNTRAAYDIAAYLWGLGHRDFGLVASAEPSPNFRLREGALAEALSERGLRRSALRRYTVEPSYEGSYRGFRQILGRKAARPPSALVCMNDLVALGVLRALRESGTSVPDQVSVIGFDNAAAAAVSDPPLSSYAVSKQEIGRRALRLLLERIEEKETGHSEKIMIAGELIPRASTGPAPSVR